MHPNQGLTIILLAHDPFSSVHYPTVTHAPPVAGNLPIQTLVARQWPTTHDVSQYDIYYAYLYTIAL